MKKTNWLVVGIIGIIALLFLFGGGMMFGGYGYRNWGMMGPGMMGSWGFSPFGWLGMIFMGLIPLGILVLTVLGVAWVVKAIGGGNNNPVASPCPSCGRGAQADWKNCPYCGAALAK